MIIDKQTYLTSDTLIGKLTKDNFDYEVHLAEVGNLVEYDETTKQALYKQKQILFPDNIKVNSYSELCKLNELFSTTQSFMHKIKTTALKNSIESPDLIKYFKTRGYGYDNEMRVGAIEGINFQDDAMSGPSRLQFGADVKFQPSVVPLLPYQYSYSRLELDVKEMQKDFPSLRFLTNFDTLLEHPYVQERDGFRRNNTYLTHDIYGHIGLITCEPSSFVHEGITYRVLAMSSHRILKIVPHTAPEYVHLDRGHVFVITGTELKRRMMISSELSYDTLLLFKLLQLFPALGNDESLPVDGFIDPTKVRNLRFRMEQLASRIKDAPLLLSNSEFQSWSGGGLVGKSAIMNATPMGYYNAIKDVATEDFKKDSSFQLVNKLINKEITKTKLHDIEFHVDKIQYNAVSIEKSDVLEIAYGNINFREQFDIYGVVAAVTTDLVKKLEDAIAAKGEVVPIEFKINGIPLVLSFHAASRRRMINGKPINIKELAKVLQNCACFNVADDVNNFIESVSKMSLEWHNALDEGVGMKMVDMEYHEYAEPNAPKYAPKLKFRREDDGIHLVAGDKTYKVAKFGTLLAHLRMINRKTKNRYSLRNAPTHRYTNYLWCSDMTEKALIKYTSVSVKDKDGNEKLTPMMTEKEAKKITEVYKEYTIKAFEKSRQLMETIAEQVGAESIDWHGRDAYKVKGDLRTYVVEKESCMVYNFDTKHSICIVEMGPGHRAGVGYDSVASRLLSLKNDSVMVDHIGTLRHG